MELINEYIHLSRYLGGFIELNQGPGGNISIKQDNNIIIKKSGALLANTTEQSNWVICNIDVINDNILRNDNSEIPILAGEGKPSIETYMHILPPKIIVHLHPIKLLQYLCNNCEIPLKSYKYKLIEYYKPGIQLAKELIKQYDNNIQIYFLKNHGIVIMGNTVHDIISIINNIYIELFNIDYINKIYNIYNEIYDKYKYNYIIKQVVNLEISDILFKKYTPDIAVFLQNEPFILDTHTLVNYINKYNIPPSIILYKNNIFIIAKTNEQCYSIYEILYCYSQIKDSLITLTDIEVNELITWDKEIERKNAK
jgi:ribulose-5-phosphate 4-epimerase/fuculose-1-phosphate aldolase